MRGIIAAIALAAAVTGTASAAAPDAKIDAIRMQLFYQTSGTLSADMTPTPDGWANTVIGEGRAREPADDMIVSVVLSSEAEAVSLDPPVTLIVRGENNMVLAKRVFESVYLRHHRVVLPLFVTGIGCVGPVIAEASFAGQKTVSKVSLLCNE